MTSVVNMANEHDRDYLKRIREEGQVRKSVQSRNVQRIVDRRKQQAMRGREKRNDALNSRRQQMLAAAPIPAAPVVVPTPAVPEPVEMPDAVTPRRSKKTTKKKGTGRGRPRGVRKVSKNFTIGNWSCFLDKADKAELIDTISRAKLLLKKPSLTAAEKTKLKKYEDTHVELRNRADANKSFKSEARKEKKNAQKTAPKKTNRGNSASLWTRALKQFNASRSGDYKIPAKGTAEYNQVRQIMAQMKPAYDREQAARLRDPKEWDKRQAQARRALVARS